jgi:glycosyltransferase involved in cell wall biosynthesis
VIQFQAIHQFHSGTALGDAITNQMIGLQGQLREMGYRSEIFAQHVAAGLQDRVRPIQGYAGSEFDLLIQHHSIGYELFDDVIELPNRIVAVYHNVTPEHYFAEAHIREHVRLGREQLTTLSQRAVLGVADSNFNRREMLAAGFRRVEVLPAKHRFDEFAVSDTDAGGERRDWLYVGRIVGNKCQRDLVAAFAIYAKRFDNEARLVLVGDTSDRRYVDEVRREAEQLGVAHRVVLLGKVSDSQLRSAFSAAGAFVSVSEHEGFGVPILEAMAAGVPVVAFGAAAIPETMGGAGILLRTKEPAIVAATVQAVQSDPELRQRLVARQQQRIKQVQAFDAAALLRRVIDRAGGARPPLEVQVQGPFETSYSLAVVNRRLALTLDQNPDNALSIYATEGPGDYVPALKDLERSPEAAVLFGRSTSVPYPDIVIRQMWPPRVIDSPGGLTCEYFGWEESRIPQGMVSDFNRYLDGVGVMSSFVRDVLRDSGVNIPIRVVGIGVDPHELGATKRESETRGLRSCTFLHVSSAFPRKGVDVLLGAFFAAFDGDSDVSLVLKTFANRHNDVEAILDRLRSDHPNPPDVRWINRDLDERAIAGLYDLADCYVHPSRGEGFGLPIAEAMAAGVPVISVAHSGQADFVSEMTATTVPFELAPAETHFDIENSEWAEPDQAQLAVELLAVAQDPRAPDRLERAERARRLIADEFSWEAVARRWEEFIADLEDSAAPMDVAMVTTWNSRCGVAENTHYIVDHADQGLNFEIYADIGVETIDELDEVGVVRTWKNRWEPDLTDLENALRTSDAEVLHIQLNFGFFEFGRIAELIERQLQRRAVVLTLHRTKDLVTEDLHLSLEEIQPILSKVDRLIVHQETDARYLAGIGLAENVTVIPIGTNPPPGVTPAEARRALALGSRPVLGTFGFLLPHKGTLELVQAVGALRDEFPDIVLLALCARYPNFESNKYEEAVRNEIAARNLENNVVLMTDYLPDETARVILRGTDLIALPYRSTGESTSAALRFVLPLERPVIVTDEPIFADARESLMVVDASKPSGLEDAIRRLLMDGELQESLAMRAADTARRFRWERVVADHREAYVAARRASRRRLLR